METMREESGWLIERADSDVSKPLYWGGRNGWTLDNLLAVRFCRRDDAQSQADIIGNHHGFRICEHGWGP
jgi:hypothetical protein